MRRIVTPFILTIMLTVGMSTAANATHNGYKYSAPTLNSLTVVSCTQIRVTWTPKSDFTSVNYAKPSDFRASLYWYAWEYGTRDQVRGATTTVVSNLRPDTRYYFRVYAGEYGGHRQSKYSNVRSVRTPAC